MSTFNFKKFTINQSKSAMKVGTDAMLLGAIIDAENFKKGLDIGAGTGVLSLMIAQKNSKIQIHAIEIDKDSALECETNFRASDWVDRLQVSHLDFLNFQSDDQFDLIFSNPPYYQTSLLNNDSRTAQAKHEIALPVNAMVNKVRSMIHPAGAFYVIVPLELKDNWVEIGLNNGLHLIKEVRILGKKEGSLKRVVLQFSLTPSNFETSILAIRDLNNEYTEEYIQLTEDFHNKPLRN